MNRDEYLKNLEVKNRRLLLKIYEREIKKLKIKIYEATEKGNDTVYLQKLHDEVEQEIKVFKQALKGYSVKSATDSYKGGSKLALLGAAELSNKFEFGSVNRNAIRVLAQTTYKPLSKMAQHIGRATLNYIKRENFENTQTVLKALNKTFGRKFAESEFLRQAGIEGVADVVVGSVSWQKAARDIRDKIINEYDYNVPYYNKKGDLQRYVQAKDYAKMVSRTTTANIAREGAKDSILDTFDGEFDLVEIIGHSVFPNSPCIPYQGNILSLEGIVKGYTTVAEAEANGLFHPNCIHSFGVTDAVMEIYRKDEYEGVNKDNEDKEEKQEGETTEKSTVVEEKEEKSEVLKLLEDSKIEKIPFENYSITPTVEQIIDNLGGGDETSGSCSSLAFAYAGNRANMKVFDFRGGDSRIFFAKNGNIKSISQLKGVESFIETEYNDYVAVNKLLNNVVENKEYYFTTGRHAAIIRKASQGFEYLELQSATNNGFKKLTKETLKKRFKAQKSYKSLGMKIKNSSILIDIESLAKNKEFETMLEYINTDIDKQKKGITGFAK